MEGDRSVVVISNSEYIKKDSAYTDLQRGLPYCLWTFVDEADVLWSRAPLTASFIDSLLSERVNVHLKYVNSFSKPRLGSTIMVGNDLPAYELPDVRLATYREGAASSDGRVARCILHIPDEDVPVMSSGDREALVNNPMTRPYIRAFVLDKACTYWKEYGENPD